MRTPIYTPLQIREVFHLEFLRWLSRKMDADRYCLKGGINLRLFFESIRYSEDMDLDIAGVRVEKVKKTVMEILASRGFSDNLKSFGIEKIVPPNMAKAKQTQTTQRFKIHLLTSAGEELFTKIEFSRRGFKGTSVVEPVPVTVLRSYKMGPLIVPHYDVNAAFTQKIQALTQRSILQARDIFDLFLLMARCDEAVLKQQMGKLVFKTAHDHIFQVEFPQFQDTVVAYLSDEDRKVYSASAMWDEIKLKTAHFIEELSHGK